MYTIYILFNNNYDTYNKINIGTVYKYIVIDILFTGYNDNVFMIVCIMCYKTCHPYP